MFALPGHVEARTGCQEATACCLSCGLCQLHAATSALRGASWGACGANNVKTHSANRIPRIAAGRPGQEAGLRSDAVDLLGAATCRFHAVGPVTALYLNDCPPPDPHQSMWATRKMGFGISCLHVLLEFSFSHLFRCLLARHVLQALEGSPYSNGWNVSIDIQASATPNSQNSREGHAGLEEEFRAAKAGSAREADYRPAQAPRTNLTALGRKPWPACMRDARRKDTACLKAFFLWRFPCLPF